MGKQKEIIELRVDDVAVDDGAGRTISRTIGIPTFNGEETCVMTFCDDDEGDVGTVTLFECFAGGTDGFDL